MLILHILPDLTTGGAELMMKRLIEAHLRDPRITHRIISLRGLGIVGPPLQAQGVEVEGLGLTSFRRLPGTFLRLRRLIRAARPDVVQTWMYHSDLIGGLAAWWAGVRNIIWGVRVADITAGMGVAANTFWVRRTCARVSRYLPRKIVYVCHSARPPHEALGYDPAKAVVIPNGYVLPAKRSASEKRQLRLRLGLPEDAILIGSAGSGGRRIEQKDYPTFVAAAVRIAEKTADAQFVIMGRQLDWDNPELTRCIRESGYVDRFHLLGERRDIGDCLAALDIFCLHSIQEGFPNVVAEAMAAAVPCVVTDVGDAALLVGTTGIVTQPRQPAQLADAIAALIAAGPEECHALGRRARLRIEEHYSIEAVADQYAGLYRSLLHV